jgi:hypothetical protein
LGSATISGNQFTLSWPTGPDQNYQVEYKDDFNAANWTPLGSTINGTGAPITVTNSVASSTQRFFRLRIVP